MIFRVKNVVIVIALALFSLISWKIYTFFFDTSNPIVLISGLTDNEYYCGDIQCTIMCDKTGEISAWLDEQPLSLNCEINKKGQEYPFAIPTKTIANGKHSFKTEITDTMYHKNKTKIERSFHVDNITLQAAFIKPDADYRVFQGRTLHLQFQVNKPIKEAMVSALANTYKCFPESPQSLIHECFIPIACEEAANEYLFSIEITDNVGNTLQLDNKFHIVPFPFRKQTIHVTQEKIQEEKEQGFPAHELDRALDEISKNSPQTKLWRNAFCTPIDVVRTTCDFGTVRTTQEKGRYIHKALDVINTPKSVVWTTQNGIIALKQRYSNSGNTVIVDHGLGVLSLFFHLDDFADIEVGQKIAKGNPIGTIGKTGYATGYHLHWEMRVNNIPVDPLQWTKPTF